MNQNLHNEIKRINEELELAFSTNYTCLNLAHQTSPKSADGIYTAGDIFKKSPLTQWLNSKVVKLAEMRVKFYEELFDTLDKKVTQKHFDVLLEENKKDLIEKYNTFTNQSKKFDQVFDGFIVKDEQLAAIIDKVIIYQAFSTPSNELRETILAYSKYIEAYFFKNYAGVVMDIANTLNDDITSAGYPSFYLGKPKISQIQKLSAKDFVVYSTRSYLIECQIKNQIHELNKELVLRQKRARKKGKSVEENFENHTRIRELKGEIGSLLPYQRFSGFLTSYIKVFEDRFCAANSPLKQKLSSQFIDMLMEMTSEEPIKNVLYEEVYIHKFELEYLDFLFKHLNQFDKVKNATKQTSSQSEMQ